MWNNHRHPPQTINFTKPAGITPVQQDAIVQMVHAGELLVAVASGMSSEYITPEIAVENWRRTHEKLMEAIYETHCTEVKTCCS